VTRQQIEQVIHGLQRLDAHTGALAEALERAEDPEYDPAVKPLAQELDELFSGYVMHMQRVTHSAATEATPVATSNNKIELF
jgi:uncharacterized protein YukE